jgi:hypothetical protein
MTIICDNEFPFDIFPFFRLTEDHGNDEPLAVVARISDIPPFIEWRQNIIMVEDIQVEFRLVNWVSLLVIVNERLSNLGFIEVKEF